MMQWMLTDWEAFGIAGQNWMLAIGGGILIYILVLVLARRGRTLRF